MPRANRVDRLADRAKIDRPAGRSPTSRDPDLAKKQSNRTAETLRELEASGDRVANWAADNAAVILGVIAGILVIAAGVGFWLQHRSNTEDAAVNALAQATSEYRVAMGADPTGGPIPEPANAELAERTRAEFADRFAAVGRAYEGMTVGSVALLEAGGLQAELGRYDEAIAHFEAARDASRGAAIEALASMRLARLAESRGDMAAAAEHFEAAARVEAYPLRADALAEAARCWAGAQERDRALAAYQRLESEFPDEPVAPHIAFLIAELRLDSRS